MAVFVELASIVPTNPPDYSPLFVIEQESFFGRCSDLDDAWNCQESFFGRYPALDDARYCLDGFEPWLSGNESDVAIMSSEDKCDDSAKEPKLELLPLPLSLPLPLPLSLKVPKHEPARKRRKMTEPLEPLERAKRVCRASNGRLTPARWCPHCRTIVSTRGYNKHEPYCRRRATESGMDVEK